MYLSKLIIVNYRSCQYIDIDFIKDDPNVYIGINDCGKTSILKAIGLLLEEKPIYHFVKENASKKDFSNSPISLELFHDKLENIGLPTPIDYTGKQTIIMGKFIPEKEDLNEEVIKEFSNHLAWTLECLPGMLWLTRIFDNENNQQATYLLTNDQVNQETGEHYQFYAMGARDLSTQRKNHQITDEEIQNLNGIGRYTTLEIIRALYHKTGTKQVWSEYKKYEAQYFPKYKYLDWNMSLDEITTTAKEIMNDIIENYATPVKQNATQQAALAETAINEQLESLKDIIAEVAPITGLKSRLRFEVKENITDLFVNKEKADGDIHMDLQGDGLKRQIWFALVKAKLAVVPTGSTNKLFIWTFDEPETHLYPTAQRQLFDIIKQVSRGSVQTFISTHSTVFIDKAKLSAIKCVHQEDHGYSNYFTCTHIDEIFHTLDLRNSDFLFYDKFLVIEGLTEQYLIPALFKIYSGEDLKDQNIQLVNLKGAGNWNQQRQAFENVLSGFKKSLRDIVYLFDNDQKFHLGAGAIQNNFFFIGKQDIEDAIDNKIWVNIVHESTDNKVTLTLDEIQEQKDMIPDNIEIRSDEKFLSRLEKVVKARLGEVEGDQIVYTVLPLKGIDLANSILKHNSKDLIPEKIIECFNVILGYPKTTLAEHQEIIPNQV